MNAQSPPLLAVQNLGKEYPLPRRSLFKKPEPIVALHQVNFQLQQGKSLGVVGESGSGKSTLAKLVMALDKPSTGSVLFKGQDLSQLDPWALRTIRSGFQMVFQDPYGSLDPRQTVLRIVTDPLVSLRTGIYTPKDLRDAAHKALEEVGLPSHALDKYPHEFSGGQRQRIAIARALITRPSLIVADEPVSALDVSVQAQVLNLMQDLQERLGISYLFISHDLSVINLICDDVLVLKEGKVVEHDSCQTLFKNPQHPYTQSLLAAIPGHS